MPVSFTEWCAVISTNGDKMSQNNNLYSLLAENAADIPDNPFFYFEDETVTYKTGAETVNRCAAYLRKKGVSKGDRVLLSLPNIPEFIYAYLACAQIGAVTVLVGPVARRYEIRYIVEETKPVMIITSLNQMENYSVDGAFFCDMNTMWLVDDIHRDRNMMSILQNSSPDPEVEPIEGDEMVSIIYTSAMDGYPLGVLMTHRGIRNSTKILSQFNKPDDIYIAALPLYHAFGLTVTIFTPLNSRIPFVLMKKFSPNDLLREIKQKGATVMPGVPLMFMMVNSLLPAGNHVPTIRACISGGEGVSPELLKLIKEKYGFEVREGYGLSEASPIVTWNHINVENRYGTVGVAMPWNEIRIVDEKGKDVPGGETGEVIVKGINVTPGYYNHPEKTELYIRDGWLHTGDLGSLDSDGYLTLKGLKKNMVLNKGFNVYPKEVERLLCYHPDVEQARISVKSEQSPGDIERFYIVAEIWCGGRMPDENEMKQWCNENISNYKIPRTFSIKPLK